MGEKMRLINVLMFAMIGSLMMVPVISATTHYVGGDFGWNLPNYPSFYIDWAKNTTFAVGDTISFQYKPGLNTVVQVDKEDYINCTSRNTLYTYFQGNTSILLDKPGHYYFFCNIGKHCEAGQKLWITVN